VGFDPLVDLVVDRVDRQISLQFLERLFHLDKLQVEHSVLRRITADDIRPQQVTAFATACRAQSLPVQANGRPRR
jgi:hypothetical protein